MKSLSFFLIILAGCAMQVDIELAKEELLETDRQFSKLSQEKGTAAAFHFYLADDGYALPFTGHPKSKDDYATAMLAAKNDDTQDGVLTWEPEFSDVAASGDLGYTWGHYTYTFFDSTTVPSHGYYVTIWKKQPDGAWRFVFDAGNQLDSKESK